MATQGEIFPAALALGALLVFLAVTLSGEALERFDPFASFEKDPPDGILQNKCLLLKRALLAIRYERWIKLHKAAADLKNLTIAAMAFFLLLFAFKALGALAALEKWLFTLVPYLTTAVLAVLNLHLKKIRLRITDPRR